MKPDDLFNDLQPEPIAPADNDPLAELRGRVATLFNDLPDAEKSRAVLDLKGKARRLGRPLDDVFVAGLGEPATTMAGLLMDWDDQRTKAKMDEALRAKDAEVERQRSRAVAAEERVAELERLVDRMFRAKVMDDRRRHDNANRGRKR
ncbi:MAG TPA: hypothetical protein VFB35_00240 [Gaiellaceae bacterium]|nr:hypothetical protein [Gaiellaceae bacterium]